MDGELSAEHEVLRLMELHVIAENVLTAAGNCQLGNPCQGCFLERALCESDLACARCGPCKIPSKMMVAAFRLAQQQDPRVGKPGIIYPGR